MGGGARAATGTPASLRSSPLGPAGPSLPLPRKYATISSSEQRQSYKNDFNAEYSEYRDLHARIEQITRRFTQLDAQLRQLSQGSEEYEVDTPLPCHRPPHSQTDSGLGARPTSGPPRVPHTGPPCSAPDLVRRACFSWVQPHPRPPALAMAPEPGLYPSQGRRAAASAGVSPSRLAVSCPLLLL